MTTIKQADLIESVAAALQYISYYHPADYIAHLARAYDAEQSPAAKDAMAQILTNSKMSATGHRPMCQDTGIVNVFLKIGMDVRWEGFTGSVDDAINEGVRRGYTHPDNTLRASVVADPQFDRKNTKDNTPAVISTELVAGDIFEVTVAAKGGGSENKSKLAMLNPGDSIVDWVLKTVPTMGAGWCPPGMLGIGIGGTAEKAMLLAKESLMEDLDMYELQAKAKSGAALTKVEALRIELFEKVNALGIGAQGLGGLTTVLDVKINMYPRRRQARSHDPKLRGHPPRPLRDGRQRPGVPDTPAAQHLARCELDTRLRQKQGSQPEHPDQSRGGQLDTRRQAAS
jgi:fumarate hydratase class I